MKNQKKKSLFCRMLAAALCFAMMAGIFMPVTVQAASSNNVTLKYKGKTINLFNEEYGAMLYSEIKKSFGEADKISEVPSGFTEETSTKYKYETDGFKFIIIQNTSTKDKTNFYLRSLEIKITSTKAALNGIKVGMPYSKVLKKLEKLYGEDHVSTQKNKKKISIENMGFPMIYSFKNGKVSKIYFYYI